MKLYRFDAGVGKKIDRFGSNFILSRIINVNENIVVSCFYIEPDGFVGYHPAATSQLFLVVQGIGWIRSGECTRTPVEVYQAVYWGKGEWHEAGTESGMTAIVFEGESLHPSKFMPLRKNS